MCRKLTQEQFLDKCNTLHNNKYDYSLVEYKGNKKHIKILCPDHGMFLKDAGSHLYGEQGCPICSHIEQTKFNSSDTYTFINKATEKHNGKYDYSKVNYINCKSKVEIICNIHGSFFQTPQSHLSGQGCAECYKSICGNNTRLTQEQFLLNCTKRHGDKYDYSRVKYVNSKTSIEIICKKHGSFMQGAGLHSSGAGCTLCYRESNSKKITYSRSHFIEKAIAKHGDLYGYDKVKYTHNKIPVEIFCKNHNGYFWIKPTEHLSGTGCGECSRNCSTLIKSNWIKRSKNKIGTFYIIRCYNDTESFYKYGITYNGVSSRYDNLVKMPYSYEIVRLVISTDKDYIWDLEKRFGLFKRSDRYSPKIYFKGSVGECFSYYGLNANRR